jgi:hypothetical protein
MAGWLPSLGLRSLCPRRCTGVPPDSVCICYEFSSALLSFHEIKTSGPLSARWVYVSVEAAQDDPRSSGIRSF